MVKGAFFLKTLCAVLLISLFSHCSVTRHLKEDQKLLVSHKITCDNRKIDTDEILNYVKPKPNRSFLGFHTRLSLYYMFANSERRLGSWMRDIVGESPVLLAETDINKNAEQIRLFLNELGYYQASVTSEIVYKKKNTKKAIARYYVTGGDVYKISSVSFQIADSALSTLLSRSSNSTKLREGNPFAIESLQEEQERIVKICKNVGYYAFSKDNVIFAADTTHGADSVSIIVSIRQTSPNSLKIHKVRSTEIDQNYSQEKRRYRPRRDTISQEEKRPVAYIKNDVLEQANFIENGEKYRLSQVEKTQSILSSYPIVKLVTIEFRDFSKNQQQEDTVDLQCHINITPAKRHSISLDVEGTNTSGDWGAEVNTTYINRNIFHGAEYLSLKLKLAEEYNNVLKTKNENMKLFNSQEYGVAVEFTTPKFLVPFAMNAYNKKFRAKTSVHLEYNYLQTPDYTRPTTNVNYGFTWYGNRYLTYNFSPIDISYIRYYDISDRFRTFLNSRDYYKYSYEDYLLFSNNFSLQYYNKRQNELMDYQYVKFLVETGGNLMNLYCNAAGKEKNAEGQYEMFSLPFAQYIKTEVDYRFYDVISAKTKFVYRIFAGIAIPYGNTNGLPSVKKYYCGGANSMRAWEGRSLGIGGHQDTSSTFKYYLGDVKLEMNFESRFHLFWLLDGAWFIDVGNIWSFWNDELEDAEFHIKDFYKDIAVGTGVGLRLDFSFLILRFDVGVKVREAYPINSNTKSHLIWGNRSLTGDDINLNIGIGYPF